MLAVRLFREHPEALERYRKRFRHVLVDEFQDTNAAQWELVRLLSEEHRSVMVVGDLDQCLVAGTAITMADRSTKPIEEVAVGDDVLSSYGSGDFRPARVERTHSARGFVGVEIIAGERTSTRQHARARALRRIGRTSCCINSRRSVVRRRVRAIKTAGMASRVRRWRPASSRAARAW